MNRLFAALLLATAWLDAHAQSSLPPCPGDYKTTTWANCFGTFTFADGRKYVGGFRDGKFHGQGTYTYADGRKYVGEYRDDKYHGQGTFTWASGEKYVGEWRDNQRNGEGIEYAANGTKSYSGLWANNTLSQAYAIDTNRFPINAESSVATAEYSGKAEQERLAAEVDVLRKRNDELEKKVRSQDGGAKKTGVQLVQLCLSRGLKPGSQQFSICIAGGE